MRDHYQEVLHDLQRRREELTQAITVVEHLMPPEDLSRHEEEHKPDSGSPSHVPDLDLQAGPYKGMKLWAAAEKLFQVSGRAMTIREMLPILREGGIGMRTQSLDSNLITALKGKPERFEKIAVNTWKLREGSEASGI
jgi:hypothetical protein